MENIIYLILLLILLLIFRIIYVFQRKKSKKIRAEIKDEQENGFKESDVPLFGAIISFLIMLILYVKTLDILDLSSENTLFTFVCIILIPNIVYRVLNKKYNSGLIEFRRKRKLKNDNNSRINIDIDDIDFT